MAYWQTCPKTFQIRVHVFGNQRRKFVVVSNRDVPVVWSDSIKLFLTGPMATISVVL